MRLTLLPSGNFYLRIFGNPWRGTPAVSEEEARKVAQALREAREVEVSSDEAFYEMTVDGVTYPITLKREGEEWKIERF